MSYNSPFTGNVIQPTDVSFRSITLAANTQLQWPINGNATDDYAARIMQVTATTAGLSLYMPPANQASVGQDALIRNTGANTFTVKDFEGTNTIVSVAAGQSQYIYITANPTTTGTWGIIAFGTGTSSADAATLAGYGLVASGTTLNQSHPAQSVVTGGTFAITDRAQALVWTGGAGTYTLPSTSTLGNNWFTLFKNNGTGSMVVSASDNIDGASTKTFAPSESAFIVCTGTTYITVGYGVSSQFFYTSLVKSVTGGTYNLSASEAANTIQTFVGTLSANVIVVYPPVVNLYVIKNSVTAAGYTLTVGTGSGTSVTIPSGQQVTLVCDGTNFFNANTTQAGTITTVSLSDGTVGSPALSYASESNTGLYRVGAGQFNTAILGVLRSTLSASGLTIAGAGTFSDGVSGGTF
tara:strand:- start:12227 stop:13456 length:1230 start_codon:yes stop_codon:yes gene_type:complete